jgi:hypothetical protein
MTNSWRHFFRRMAKVLVVSGSMAWSSALCYAQIAFDSASDPVYADGWQAGDNGGFGFTPWNFDSAYYWAVANGGDGMWYPYNGAFHEIDDGLKAGTQFSNPYNNIGRAWAVGSVAYLHEPSGEMRNSFPRAGRGFAPLQIGQTLKVTIDNPTEELFFKGYFIRLNGGTGGMNGNICNATGVSCTPNAPRPSPKMGFNIFEYSPPEGGWTISDADDVETNLLHVDTAEAGAVFSVTRTGEDTYDVVMDPLGSAPSFTASRMFASPGVPVDWIELTFFNTASDTGTPPTIPTDFYIRSIEITGPAPEGVPGDYNDNGSVDAADYVLWRNGGPLQNEVPGVTPGQATAEDYAAWRARFGNTSPVGAGSQLQGATAPEPSTFVLLAGIVTGSLVFCGSFRSRQALKKTY